MSEALIYNELVQGKWEVPVWPLLRMNPADKTVLCIRDSYYVEDNNGIFSNKENENMLLHSLRKGLTIYVKFQIQQWTTNIANR